MNTQSPAAAAGRFTFPGTAISVNRMGYGAMQLAGPHVFGEPRDHHAHDHAHESPPTMWIPLAVLAVLAVIAGRERLLQSGPVPFQQQHVAGLQLNLPGPEIFALPLNRQDDQRTSEEDHPGVGPLTDEP